MGDTKFTPGPWRVARSRDGFVIAPADDEARVTIRGSGGAVSYSRQVACIIDHGKDQAANAHLIAAAPLMYCQIDEAPDCDLLSPDEFYNAYRQWLIDAKRTLAQAREEQTP